MEIAEASAAGDRFIEHGAARHLLDVLPEVTDGHLLRNGDVAVVGRLLADDHAKERRLARAVRPDQPRALARVELERGVDEDELPAVLFGDSGETDHERAAERLRVWWHFGRTGSMPS